MVIKVLQMCPDEQPGKEDVDVKDGNEAHLPNRSVAMVSSIE
jgi:hypothetical protein